MSHYVFFCPIKEEKERFDFLLFPQEENSMKKRNLRKLALLLPSLIIVLVFLISGRSNGGNQVAKLRFGISFTKEQSRTPLDGRVLLMVSIDRKSVV